MRIATESYDQKLDKLRLVKSDLPQESVIKVLIATPSRDTEGLLRELLPSKGLAVGDCFDDLSDLVLPAGRGILLLDCAFIQNEKGFPTLRSLVRLSSATRILVIGGAPNTKAKRDMLECGAHGHITLSNDMQSFAKAIKAVVAGELWFSRQILAEVVSDHFRGQQENTLYSDLTPQEKTVAQLVCQGLRNREIATKLSICEKTVKVHIGHVYKKLSVSSRVQLCLLLFCA